MGEARMIVELAEEVWGLAEGGHVTTHKTAVSRRSCRQPVAPAGAEESARAARQRRNHAGATEGNRRPRDRARHQEQEDVGLQSITDGEFRRSWWHLDFLWGLDGVEKHVMDTGMPFAAVTTATKAEGHRKARLFRPSDDRAFQIRRGAHQAYAEDHDSGAVGAYGRPMRTPIDEKIYPKLDRFFDDLGQAYKKAVRAFADAGCRYLQLDEVFIAMLCDPKYRAADEGSRRRSGTARRALR